MDDDLDRKNNINSGMRKLDGCREAIELSVFVKDINQKLTVQISRPKGSMNKSGLEKI